MPNHMIVLPPNDANKENVAPSANPLANVHSTAREALAAHSNRLTKKPGKRSCCLRSSDAKKVESLLCFIDGTETAFALVDDATRHLSSIGNVGNSDGPSASVGIVIAVAHDTLGDCVVQGSPSPFRRTSRRIRRSPPRPRRTRRRRSPSCPRSIPSTLSIKDEKELPFSFASSKDLEKEISFSSMIFRCELFCCTRSPRM